MPKRTYREALLRGKCPRCREGDIFVYPLKKISKFNVMHQTCPHCGVMFQPEPGFYQGAMFVGYAFTVVILVTISVILYILGNPSEWIYMISLVTVVILVAPLNYRYSRIVYLYLFGGLQHRP